MAIGRPISLTPNIATKAINSVATANQTEFTVTGGYRINELAVYRNGVRLAQGRDFTASDGTTVTLTNGATLNDVIEFVVFDSFNVAGTIVSAASSQTLSGDLNVTGKLYGGTVDTDSLNIGVGTFVSAVHVGTAITIDAAGNTNTTGIVTAASFSGDGSALTGLANTDFIVSVATTTGNLNVSAAATITGVVNIDATTDSTSTTTGALIVDGGVGIAKNVYIGAGLSVAGTLTYEDVTNVDSVGLITAKSGVNITGGQLTVGSGITMGIAGVATFSGTADIHLKDNVRLNVGDASDLSIYHNGSHSYIEDSGTGRLIAKTSYFEVDNAAGNAAIIEGIESGAVKLYYSGNQKLETTTTGATISGEATADGLIVGSGITFGSAGVATFSGTGDVHLLDNVALNIGDGSDLKLYHNGSNSYVTGANTGNLLLQAHGNIKLMPANGEDAVEAVANDAVKLYYNNSQKFQTTNDGAVTTGIATATLGIDAAISVWTLGADGSSHYTFTGPGNLSGTNDPTLNLIRGQKYTFKNRSGGHPFRIQSTINGSAGTAYNTGVTNNDGGDGTNIIFDVPYDAPAVLYYQCTSHGSMGGAMYISGSGYETKIGTGITISATSGIATFADGSNVTNGLHFGTGADLRIYADGSNSRIDHNGDGNLRIFSGGAESIKCTEAAGVHLFNNGTEMCYTNAAGLKFNDNKKITIGTAGDFNIFHDGSDTYLSGDVDGLDVFLRSRKDLTISCGNNSSGYHSVLYADNNGTTRLYHPAADAEKLRTTNDGVNITGIATVSQGMHFQGMLREDVNIVANKLSAASNINLEDGMVHYFSTNETGSGTPNIRWNSSFSLNNKMSTGEVVTVTIIYKPNGAGYYPDMTIDGSNVTEEWNGGSAPSSANAGGFDVLTNTLVKTADATFLCLSNVQNYA